MKAGVGLKFVHGAKRNYRLAGMALGQLAHYVISPRLGFQVLSTANIMEYAIPEIKDCVRFDARKQTVPSFTTGVGVCNP